MALRRAQAGRAGAICRRAGRARAIPRLSGRGSHPLLGLGAICPGAEAADDGHGLCFPGLEPQGSRADQILLTAAAAPSLAAYLESTANPNVLYSQLRDTAYANAQASGNLTPDPRILANLDRLRSIPNKGRFMVVDSGNQTLTLFENGRPYDSMKVVAGKTEYPTPMIASIMYYMVYNPYWNAPDHLVRKIAQNYLTMGDLPPDRGYQVMKDWPTGSEVLPSDQVNWKAVASGKEQIRIRQKPSDDNSMGDLKFPFPNNLDIFLHDTPHKEYFARSSRMLSNGCVRLKTRAASADGFLAASLPHRTGTPKSRCSCRRACRSS